jgi:hypothetical protein
MLWMVTIAQDAGLSHIRTPLASSGMEYESKNVTIVG